MFSTYPHVNVNRVHYKSTNLKYYWILHSYCHHCLLSSDHKYHHHVGHHLYITLSLLSPHFPLFQHHTDFLLLISFSLLLLFLAFIFLLQVSSLHEQVTIICLLTAAFKEKMCHLDTFVFTNMHQGIMR